MSAARAVPSLLWGLNSLTLLGPTPVPSPRPPLQMKTQNHFKSPLAGPASKSHVTDVLPVFPGFRDPCAFSLAHWMKRVRWISSRSPLLLPRVWASLQRSRQAPHSSTPGRSKLQSFLSPARLQTFGKWKPEACPGENVGRPAKQVILQIPFPKEGVKSLVRFGRKAMEKWKEIFDIFVPYFSLPFIKNKPKPNQTKTKTQ